MQGANGSRWRSGARRRAFLLSLLLHLLLFLVLLALPPRAPGGLVAAYAVELVPAPEPEVPPPRMAPEPPRPPPPRAVPAPPAPPRRAEGASGARQAPPPPREVRVPRPAPPAASAPPLPAPGSPPLPEGGGLREAPPAPLPQGEGREGAGAEALAPPPSRAPAAREGVSPETPSGPGVAFHEAPVRGRGGGPSQEENLAGGPSPGAPAAREGLAAGGLRGEAPRAGGTAPAALPGAGGPGEGAGPEGLPPGRGTGAGGEEGRCAVVVELMGLPYAQGPSPAILDPAGRQVWPEAERVRGVPTEVVDRSGIALFFRPGEFREEGYARVVRVRALQTRSRGEGNPFRELVVVGEEDARRLREAPPTCQLVFIR